MASSNEYSRKILNSPHFAEPCLVHSAKKVLQPDNWCVIFFRHPKTSYSLVSFFRVFLTGKSHVEYRRVLNTLFTRKALG
jgi:C-22 sterol desaturase